MDIWQQNRRLFLRLRVLVDCAVNAVGWETERAGSIRKAMKSPRCVSRNFAGSQWGLRRAIEKYRDTTGCGKSRMG